MALYSLRDFGTVGRNPPAAPAVARPRADLPASIALFPTRARRGVVTVATPDREDRFPPPTTEISHLRWPAWTGAIALHLVVVAAIVTLVSALSSRPETRLQITLVFEPPAAPSATVEQAAPPPAEASPEPPPQAQAAETTEPPAAEQPVAEPKDLAPPPPRPVAKPAQNHRPAAAKRAPAARDTTAPPQEQPAGETQQTAAPPPAPAIRTTPIANLARNREPDYPVAARSRGQEGKALLRVEVSAAGDALDVRLVSSTGFAALDQAALTAVREWQFTPATVDGKPVAGIADVPVYFRLND